MGKSTISFEWQELHEDQKFLPISTPSAPKQAASAGCFRPKYTLIGGALGLLLVALLGAIWVRQQAEAGLAQIQHELAAVVDAEIWQAARLASSPDALGDIVARQAAKGKEKDVEADQVLDKVIGVEVAALRRDVAAVITVVEKNILPGGPPMLYRQLHFYRQTDQGWQPTESIPSLWGQLQILTTKHFDITYRSRDAQAVQTVAAELDALYAQVRRNFGLPSIPENKMAVEVAVREVSRRRSEDTSASDSITVFSPVLLHVPDSLTDAVVLRQSILFHLVDKAMEEAVSIHWISPRWHPLLSAMRLWQIGEMCEPLAAWCKPAFLWARDIHPMISDASSTLPAVLPAAYAEVCALDKAWNNSLLRQGIPFHCSAEEQVILASWGSRGNERVAWPKRKLRLPSYCCSHQGHLILSVTDEVIRAQERYELILTLALLDYVAATYGRAQIGALWPVLHEHNDWQSLIPAAFGVSVEEFEAGWQVYLDKMFDE